MNNVIKKLIKRKNCLSECQRKSGNLNYANLNSITQDASNAVNSSKLKYRGCLQFFFASFVFKNVWKLQKAVFNLEEKHKLIL